MKFHASVRSVQWWAATQEGRMPLCFFLSMPAVCSWQLCSLPVTMGSQSKVLTHQKSLAAQQLTARPAAQTSPVWAEASGCIGQVARAAPLRHKSTAKTVGNLSSISNHLPTCFQLWQHWRFLTKEKKSWPLKVERCFRHLCQQLQQGPSRASKVLKELQGEERRMSKPPYAKEIAPAWLQPPGWSPPPMPKGEITPKGVFSSMLICLLGPLKTKCVWCFRNAHLWYFSKPLSIFFPLWQTEQLKSISIFL